MVPASSLVLMLAVLGEICVARRLHNKLAPVRFVAPPSITSRPNIPSQRGSAPVRHGASFTSAFPQLPARRAPHLASAFAAHGVALRDVNFVARHAAQGQGPPNTVKTLPADQSELQPAEPAREASEASMPGERPPKESDGEIGVGTLVAAGAAVGVAEATVLAKAKLRSKATLEKFEGSSDAEDRFLIVALVALAYVIWQMDKVNLSVAIIPMAAQYGWDPAEVGLIQSSLFWGYAASTILGGILANKFGGKPMLLASVTLFSGGTILGPLAASISTTALIGTRVLVGIGEGMAPGAALTLIGAWVPDSERSRAVSLLGSGKNAGSIFGLLLAPFVIGAFGWQALFYAFGSLGFIWAVFWLLYGKDRDCNATECEVPDSSGPSDEGGKDDLPIPWLRILTTPALWGVFAAHFAHDWGGYALLTWTPKYLNQVLGYDLQGSSQLTIIPGACAVGVAAISSTFADGLLKNGMELTQVRKLAQGLGFLIPSVCIGTLGMLTDVSADSLLPIVLIVVGVATGALSYSGLYASHADLNKKYSGLVSGISTTFGALAGFGSNAFAGYMLKETGSWSQAIFMPSVVLFLAGGAIYQYLYDATPVDWDAPADNDNPPK